MNTRPLRLILVEAFSLVWSISVNAQVIEIPPLFVGHDILKEQYGITSHITWKGYDYDNYLGNLSAISECGIDKIRIDFNYGAINWGKGEANFTIWDQIYKEVYNKGLNITPIFFLKRDERYRGELANSYNLYVQECLNRYGEKISEWEVGNEMDMKFPLDGKMPPIDYLALLKDTYQNVKAHDTQSTVLMGAIGDIGNGYFEELLKLNADDYCDALSIHYYSNKAIPESIIRFYNNLNTTIATYSVKKPIWLTETGYCTFNDFTDPDLFYTEVLPDIYKKLGINTNKTILTLLLSPIESHSLFKQDNPAIYYGFKRCEAKELSDLRILNVRTHPVVMVLFGERFPFAYFNDLKEYVARGGTVVFPEGGAVLYYDWNLKNGQIKSIGKQYYKQLHIDYLFPWEKEAKSRGIGSRLYDVRTSSDIGTNYSWADDDFETPKFLTSNNLKEGDQFYTMVEGKNGNYDGTLAACYKLNSDLKGNVIIQTRNNNTHRISEQHQALRIPRLYLLSFAMGVDKIYYYCLKDYVNKDCYGLLHSDYTQKNAYRTLKALIRMCPNGSSRPVVKIQGHQYISSWKTPKGEKVYGVWTDAVGCQTNIVIKGKARYYDAEGQVLRRKAFQVSPSIVYIEGAKSVDFCENQ